jgi:phosphohistidine phosphatase
MTTRRLVLVRHAKAAEGAVDVERSLTGRGGRDAAAIGEWLARHSLVPDRVAVSPARRAGETWEHAAAVFAARSTPVVDERIYLNTVNALLSVVRGTPAKVQILAVVGHNPSMAELAGALEDDHADADARRSIDGGFPTSGVAVFMVHTPWSQLAPHAGTLTHFSAPRG